MTSKIKKTVVGLVALLLTMSVPLRAFSHSDSKDNDDTIVLSKDNLITLSTEIDGESTAQVLSTAKELDNALSKKEGLFSKKKHLRLFLNSPGGSIQSGLEMIEGLQGLGRPIDTVSLFSASMAFQLIENLGERLVLKNGVLMSHHAKGEVEGEFGGSIKSQMENRMQLWIDRVRELDEQTVKRTNGKQTYESYTKEYDHECWLSGTKAVEQGYADRIVKVKCDQSLSGVSTHTTEFMGLAIQYDLDNCPINTTPMNVRISQSTQQSALTPALEEEVKNKFKERFLNKQKQVVTTY